MKQFLAIVSILLFSTFFSAKIIASNTNWTPLLVNPEGNSYLKKHPKYIAKEQLRDWALFAILNKMGLDSTDLTHAIYDLSPIRDQFSEEIINFQHGQGRLGYLPNQEAIFLIPHQPNSDMLELNLADRYLMLHGTFPSKVHYYEYEIDTAQLSIQYRLNPNKSTENYQDSNRWGYREAVIANANQLNNFIESIDDLIQIRPLTGNSFFAAGRNFADQQDAISLDNVATIYKAIQSGEQFVFSLDPKLDHDAFASKIEDLVNNPRRVYELLFNREGLEIEEITFVNELVQKYRDELLLAAHDLRNNKNMWALNELEGSLSGVFESFQIDSLKNKDLSERQMKIVDDVWHMIIDAELIDVPNLKKDCINFKLLYEAIASLRGDYGLPNENVIDGNLWKILLSLVQDIPTYANQTNRAEQIKLFQNMLRKLNLASSTIEPRYEPKWLKDTEVGMTMFYTDYVMKSIGSNVDNIAEQFESFAPDFQHLEKLNFSRLLYEDYIEKYKGGRYWISSAHNGYEKFQDNNLRFSRASTQLNTQATSQLFDDSGYGSLEERLPHMEAIVNSWNQNYHQIAAFEKQYHKLNQYMKWSLALQWLIQTIDLTFLEEITIDYSYDFERWRKENKELKVFVQSPSLDKDLSIKQLEKIWGGVVLGGNPELVWETKKTRSNENEALQMERPGEYTFTAGMDRMVESKGYSFQSNTIVLSKKKGSDFEVTQPNRRWRKYSNEHSIRKNGDSLGIERMWGNFPAGSIQFDGNQVNFTASYLLQLNDLTQNSLEYPIEAITASPATSSILELPAYRTFVFKYQTGEEQSLVLNSFNPNHFLGELQNQTFMGHGTYNSRRTSVLLQPGVTLEGFVKPYRNTAIYFRNHKLVARFFKKSPKFKEDKKAWRSQKVYATNGLGKEKLELHHNEAVFYLEKPKNDSIFDAQDIDLIQQLNEHALQFTQQYSRKNTTITYYDLNDHSKSVSRKNLLWGISTRKRVKRMEYMLPKASSIQGIIHNPSTNAINLRSNAFWEVPLRPTSKQQEIVKTATQLMEADSTLIQIYQGMEGIQEMDNIAMSKIDSNNHLLRTAHQQMRTIPSQLIPNDVALVGINPFSKKPQFIYRNSANEIYIERPNLESIQVDFSTPGAFESMTKEALINHTAGAYELLDIIRRRTGKSKILLVGVENMLSPRKIWALHRDAQKGSDFDVHFYESHYNLNQSLSNLKANIETNPYKTLVLALRPLAADEKRSFESKGATVFDQGVNEYFLQSQIDRKEYQQIILLLNDTNLCDNDPLMINGDAFTLDEQINFFNNLKSTKDYIYVVGCRPTSLAGILHRSNHFKRVIWNDFNFQTNTMDNPIQQFWSKLTNQPSKNLDQLLNTLLIESFQAPETTTENGKLYIKTMIQQWESSPNKKL